MPETCSLNMHLLIRRIVRHVGNMWIRAHVTRCPASSNATVTFSSGPALHFEGKVSARWISTAGNYRLHLRVTVFGLCLSFWASNLGFISFETDFISYIFAFWPLLLLNPLCVLPPSSSNTLPVKWPAPWEQMNNTNPAKSSGLPTRPDG